MAARKPRSAPEPGSRVTTDPVAYWRQQHGQAKRDSKLAREHAPSVLPKMVALEREAWRELVAAMAAAQAAEAEAAAVRFSAGAGGEDLALEAELATAQRMRKAAEAAGSHVAARQLLKDEREISERIRARDAELARRRLAHLDETSIVELVVEVASSLPEPVKARLREALG